MKKIFLSLIFTILLPSTIFPQENQLSWRFTNPEVITGSPQLFQFDIEVKCSETGTFFRDMQIYFDYNNAVFGENIKANNNIKLQKIGIMAGEIAPEIFKYSWVNENSLPDYNVVSSKLTVNIADNMLTDNSNELAVNNISFKESKDQLNDLHLKKSQRPQISNRSANRMIFNPLGSFPHWNAQGEYAIATDGNYFYSARWNSNEFYRYDMDGNYVATFTIEGVGYLRDMAYDGQFFYGSNNSSVIFEIDLANETLISSISTNLVNIRAIAYDPVNDGFWVSNGWNPPLTLVSRSGLNLQIVETEADSFAGLAWESESEGGPFLWAYCQSGFYNDLVQIEIATGEVVQIFDVCTVFPLVGSAGGVNITNLAIPGKLAFLGASQNDLVWMIEFNTKVFTPYGADNTVARFAVFTEFLVEAPPSPTFHTLMPEEWIGFARVQIEVTASGFAGIQFTEFLMNGGQYYIGEDGEPIAYTHEAIYVNNLLDFEIIICDAPTDLYAEDITGNSVTLGWTAGYNEPLWNILWDEAAFDPQTQGTLIENWNENTYQLSGLVIETDYEFYVQAVCGADYSDWSGPYLFTTQGINTILHLEDVLLQTGEGVCFEATQTIYVAGNGTYFIVENNASAELVAGHNIVFLPGTLVVNGGMLHAWITEDETYCNNTSSLLASNEEEYIFADPFKSEKGDLFFKVYPNPTAGLFTLELSDHLAHSEILIKIYSMLGELMMSQVLPASNLYTFSLAEKEQGIYIVRVLSDNMLGTARIIKQ